MEISIKDNGKISGRVKLTFHNILTGIDDIFEFQNVICNSGKESWAGRSAGADNLGKITYMALGTGTTAPDATDTALETEIYRKQNSISSYSANEATFKTFFSTEEANDTLKEIGLFGDDASGTADSGTLFAHRAIDRTKADTETLTVEWVISFN